MVDTYENNTIAVLGPEGTWSHQAALKYNPTRNLSFFESIEDVIDQVSREEIPLGILPFENSLEGTIIPTLDGLYRERLLIQKEIVIPIQHCICGLNKDFENVTHIYSHQQALRQCRNYLKNKHAEAKLIHMQSTSAAFRKIKEENLLNSLAIGPRIAASVYGLNVVDEDIQDSQNNQTAFIAVGKTPMNSALAEKSTLVIDPRQDRIGLLLEILEVFKNYNLNLSKIDSRPSREKLGSYIFYITLEPFLDDIYKAIIDLKKLNMNITSLGSYEVIR
jgi:prephenate dehydratase